MLLFVMRVTAAGAIRDHIGCFRSCCLKRVMSEYELLGGFTHERPFRD